MSLSVTIVYTVMLHMEGFPVRYMMPDNDRRPRWFPGPFSDPGEASQEFQAAYGQECRYVSVQEFDGLVRNVEAAE